MEKKGESGSFLKRGEAVPRDEVQVPEIVSPLEGLSRVEKMRLEAVLYTLLKFKTEGIYIKDETKVGNIMTMVDMLKGVEEILKKLGVSTSIRDIMHALKEDEDLHKGI